MSDLLKALIPQGRRGLGLWFILFVISFGGYHFWGPYSVFEHWYYAIERQPERDQNVLAQQTDIAVAHIRIQRPVADFLESEVVITVQNMTTKTQTAVVGLEIGTNTTQTAPQTPPRVYIRTPLTTRMQDVVSLEDIPPYGKVSAVFLVRIANGEKGCEYPLEFIINGKYAPNTQIAFEYNPPERLRMWLVSLLLLPPGSNIAIPVLTMLFASWLESLSTLLKRKSLWWDIVNACKVLLCRNNWERLWNNLRGCKCKALMGIIDSRAAATLWRPFSYTLPWLVMMLFLCRVLTMALPPELPATKHIIFAFIGGTLCCFCPLFYNLLGSKNGRLLIAKTSLPQGYQLTRDDLDAKIEDEIGLLSAEKLNAVIHKRLKRYIEGNRPILESDLE